MTTIHLDAGWAVLQDVHDNGEFFQIYNVASFDATAPGAGVSEWEPIDRLQHLQVLFERNPYWGRSLRHYNAAPWWYRVEFDLEATTALADLRFSNVDYFGRFWLNGTLLGEHEGYGTPFSFDVGSVLRPGRNVLVVKVWSPWDESVADPTPVKRTLRVNRDLIKGTYEHDDTLGPRDVNPIGIYGIVQLTLHDGARLRDTRISTRLDTESDTGHVRVTAAVDSPAPDTSMLLTVRDADSGATVAEWHGQVGDQLDMELEIGSPRLWAPWDHGQPARYLVQADLDGELLQLGTAAFRTVALQRRADRTAYEINGEFFFVRGTSYLPDAYLSTMNRARYLRDLLAIKASGCNTVRVHVHTEQAVFYDLCDELGLAVIQDTDYNWNHPADEEWQRRFIAVSHAMVEMLDQHPCIITWVALNEPGNSAADDEGARRAMEVSPGPQILEALQRWDPTRPVIKGSWADEDPESGDSHNYTGSLWAPDIPYTDIDGTTERFNTEFGFDAPASWDELRQFPDLARRFQSVERDIPGLQEYQYALTSYYIDHYRADRNNPTSGYVQFMFIDLAPQSFYGAVSHAGVPKRGYEALLDANQPVAVLLRRTATQVTDVVVINDHPRALGSAEIRWVITNGSGQVMLTGGEAIELAANSISTPHPLNLRRSEQAGPVHVHLTLTTPDGVLLAKRDYRDVFHHPEHPLGHPDRMSHEYGTRLYNAVPTVYGVPAERSTH